MSTPLSRQMDQMAETQKYKEKVEYLESEVALWKGIAQSYREEEQKSEVVLQLRPAKWRSEIEKGEAGIWHEWEIIDEKDKPIGKLVSWSNGKYGLFLDSAHHGPVRVELDGTCLSVRRKIVY